jgi:replication-associated recombination protein RarA
MGESELWYAKYRPHTLEEFVWRDAKTKKKLTDWIEGGKIPHLILSGPYGTGKTSFALLMVEVMGLEASDYLFVNASLNTGVDTIRTDIIGFCENAGWSGQRLVVLDEADRLSASAQDSLKGVMDTYGDSTRFIFTSNHIHRMTGALKSRARTIMFDVMDSDSFITKLGEIGLAEGVLDLDDGAQVAVLEDIMDKTYPDLRKAIDLLQDCVIDGVVSSLSMTSEAEAPWEDIVANALTSVAGVIPLRDMLASIPVGEMEKIYRYLYENVPAIYADQDADKGNVAVLKIAEYLDLHSRSAFPDITLAALIIELSRL